MTNPTYSPATVQSMVRRICGFTNDDADATAVYFRTIPNASNLAEVNKPAEIGASIARDLVTVERAVNPARSMSIPDVVPTCEVTLLVVIPLIIPQTSVRMIALLLIDTIGREAAENTRTAAESSSTQYYTQVRSAEDAAVIPYLIAFMLRANVTASIVGFEISWQSWRIRTHSSASVYAISPSVTSWRNRNAAVDDLPIFHPAFRTPVD